MGDRHRARAGLRQQSLALWPQVVVPVVPLQRLQRLQLQQQQMMQQVQQQLGIQRETGLPHLLPHLQALRRLLRVRIDVRIISGQNLIQVLKRQAGRTFKTSCWLCCFVSFMKKKSAQAQECVWKQSSCAQNNNTKTVL